MDLSSGTCAGRARVFWHIDQHSISQEPEESDRLLEEIVPSLKYLMAQHHGRAPVCVEAHCNQAACPMETDMVWYLGQCRIPVKRHRDTENDNAAQTAILRQLLHGLQSHVSSLFFPVCLVTDDERLILTAYHLLRSRLILCTSLTEWDSVAVLEVLRDGGQVYQWSSEYGVGAKYPVFL